MYSILLNIYYFKQHTNLNKCLRNRSANDVLQYICYLYIGKKPYRYNTNLAMFCPLHSKEQNEK